MPYYADSIYFNLLLPFSLKFPLPKWKKKKRRKWSGILHSEYTWNLKRNLEGIHVTKYWGIVNSEQEVLLHKSCIATVLTYTHLRIFTLSPPPCQKNAKLCQYRYSLCWFVVVYISNLLILSYLTVMKRLTIGSHWIFYLEGSENKPGNIPLFIQFVHGLSYYLSICFFIQLTNWPLSHRIIISYLQEWYWAPSLLFMNGNFSKKFPLRSLYILPIFGYYSKFSIQVISMPR